MVVRLTDRVEPDMTAGHSLGEYAALHGAGLVTLTHTPSPMGFLNQLLGRPKEERPFLLLVTGYPAPDARVPNLSRSPLSDISTFI